MVTKRLLLLGCLCLGSACTWGCDDSEPFTSNGLINDGGTDGDTDTDIDTAAECSNLPELPLEFSTLSTIGAEDFAFDNEGHLVVCERGSSNVFKQTYGGEPQLFVPNIGEGSSAGTKVMGNGDIIVSFETGPMFKITADGTVTTITQNVGANGIAIGNDGYIYGASYWGNPPGLFRVHPNTGEAERLSGIAPEIQDMGFDGVTLATGYESIFVNEGEWLSDGSGKVYELEFKSDGTVELIETIIPLSGNSGTLDSMATDICGNLYIVVSNLFGNDECAGSGVFRVTPSGDSALVSCFGNGAFAPSLNFGSGVGGWERDHLYVIDWGGQLYDIDVGVRGKYEPYRSE